MKDKFTDLVFKIIITLFIISPVMLLLDAFMTNGKGSFITWGYLSAFLITFAIYLLKGMISLLYDLWTE